MRLLQQPANAFFDGTDTQINLINSYLFSSMLHKHTLSLDLTRQPDYKPRCPQINDVIRNTIDHQISQHVRVPPIKYQHALIERTKRVLKGSKAKNTTISQRLTPADLNETRRCGTSAFKIRRHGELNETKRKLELLSEIHQKCGKDQIRRYRQQIEQEQSQIHATIARYNLKRVCVSTTAKSKKTRAAKSTLLTPRNQSEEQASRQESKPEEGDVQLCYDRLKPYRRMLLIKRKSKGIFSPWNLSQVTPNL